jgi:hypothetical protein
VDPVELHFWDQFQTRKKLWKLRKMAKLLDKRKNALEHIHNFLVFNSIFIFFI